MRKMTSQASILLVGFFVYILAHGSSAAFPKNRKRNCAVSVWSSWGPSNPAGTKTRTRVILRNPRNGGLPCPALTQGETKADPWDRQEVPKKFHNKFITGTTRYFRFVSKGQGGSGTNSVLTLLPRDLLFLIDMSGSISQSHWTLTKQKLADLIERLCGSIGLGVQDNRIAIVTFSRRVVLNFNYKTHWTIASVRRAILGMPQDSQGTCTGDAFIYAHKYMFDPDTGIRSATESVKEVLVLTDGHSNCGAALPRQVIRLQVKAFVFALAIGDFAHINRTEIESMVSRPLIDHIFSLSNFIEFRVMVDEIMRYPAKCVPVELSK